jgi:hypothetical protein
MPDQLDRLYRAVPTGFERWRPVSWDGIPGETFNALEQVCHVRDIEVDGYQARIRRLLAEADPFLPSLDGYALAKERRYDDADPAEALASFRAARTRTLTLIDGLSQRELHRRGVFEGYGAVTLAGLLQYLCSHDQQHLACLHWLLGQIASS